MTKTDREFCAILISDREIFTQIYVSLKKLVLSAVWPAGQLILPALSAVTSAAGFSFNCQWA